MLKFTYLLLLPLWLSAAEQIPLSARRSAPFTPSFNQFVAENLERWHTPGLAVAIIDGEETYSKVRTSYEFLWSRREEYK